MSHNQINMYSIDAHIAEIYDRSEDYSDDVTLLRRLMDEQTERYQRAWNIFEPFCGTGRMLVPLAAAGHRLTGMDQAAVMLDCCREKLERTGLSATLIEGDVISAPWPEGFELIILGGNCLYELASADEQEHCIRAAATALRPGGFIYLDNDHMEGELAANWQDTRRLPGFPSGTCQDGVRLESTTQVVWFDAAARLARFQRSTRAIYPDGKCIEQTYMQQKHPVSTGEMTGWLKKYGFTIQRLFGSRAGDDYTPTSERAIFWAQRGF